MSLFISKEFIWMHNVVFLCNNFLLMSIMAWVFIQTTIGLGTQLVTNSHHELVLNYFFYGKYDCVKSKKSEL